jgi:diaminohydroxyphosphoribosylaminopyrimidine deaminase / 5-amino-6-(5-phosphoribosylamino)uracil reductase
VGRRRWSERDLGHLHRALELAARGAGETSPNPMVGAVLVRGGRVVGRGFHRRAGAPHAEITALEQAGERARGARLYVNLEPCCHFGRTPPCVDALIAAGVSEVVACMRDPDPRVNGKGFRALRKAGITVRSGALVAAARRLNERFIRYAASGVPYVTLKAGMSLDGRIATRSGQSKWITSAEARRDARRLRRAHDAVLVGIGTVLADDPGLGATEAAPSRAPAGGRRGRARRPERGPIRVVLDARLRTPPGARLLANGAGGEVVILSLPGAAAVRRRRLEKAGALVVEVPGRRGRIDFRTALAELGRRGVTSLLVEGGSEVLGDALDRGIGDRLVLYVSGRILGGRKALPAFGGRGARLLSEAASLREMSVRAVGRDYVVEGRLVRPRWRRRA